MPHDRLYIIFALEMLRSAPTASILQVALAGLNMLVPQPMMPVRFLQIGLHGFIIRQTRRRTTYVLHHRTASPD